MSPLAAKQEPRAAEPQPATGWHLGDSLPVAARSLFVTLPFFIAAGVVFVLISWQTTPAAPPAPPGPTLQLGPIGSAPKADVQTPPPTNVEALQIEHLSISADSGTTPGALLEVTNLAPGQTRSTSVQVTNDDVAAAVAMHAQNQTSDGPPGSSDLGTVLQLVVRDATTNTVVYDGTFHDFSDADVCGNGGNSASNPGVNSCSNWASKETHTFVISVSLPQSVGNAYQATSVGADFSWSAS